MWCSIKAQAVVQVGGDTQSGRSMRAAAAGDMRAERRMRRRSLLAQWHSMGVGVTGCGVLEPMRQCVFLTMVHEAMPSSPRCMRHERSRG